MCLPSPGLAGFSSLPPRGGGSKGEGDARACVAARNHSLSSIPHLRHFPRLDPLHHRLVHPIFTPVELVGAAAAAIAAEGIHARLLGIVHADEVVPLGFGFDLVACVLVVMGSPSSLGRKLGAAATPASRG